MSRSFKHTPVYKECSDRAKVRKYYKRQANKHVRKNWHLGRKSNDYKKGRYDSWSICDYRFYDTGYDSFSEAEIKHWKKCYLRK